MKRICMLAAATCLPLNPPAARLALLNAPACARLSTTSTLRERRRRAPRASESSFLAPLASPLPATTSSPTIASPALPARCGVHNSSDVLSLPSVSGTWSSDRELQTSCSVAIPEYLTKYYSWAYVHPLAVRFWDRQWMVNLILYGNYDFLRSQALAQLTRADDGLIHGRLLQVSCAYGDISTRAAELLADDARFDVIDVLKIQLDKMTSKLGHNTRVVPRIQDATNMQAFADNTFDQVLSYFLMHEQPWAVRAATLRESIRVCRPGGKVVLVDFHPPHWRNPRRYSARLVFALAEPFAIDMFRHDVREFLPNHGRDLANVEVTPFVGGLFQMVVITK